MRATNCRNGSLCADSGNCFSVNVKVAIGFLPQILLNSANARWSPGTAFGTKERDLAELRGMLLGVGAHGRSEAEVPDWRADDDQIVVGRIV